MKRIPKASGSIGRLLLCALLAGVASQVCADQYGYDELGNVQTLTSPRGTRTYTYDEIQRLDTEAGFSGQRDHAYDLNGNRTTDSASTPGTPTTATYTANTNRVATINGAAVSIDAAGQITNDGLNTYTWDDAGRLKTVSRGGQLRATYHYDHKHRRTRKVTTAAAPQGSKTLFFHYDDQDRLIAETTETGAPVRSYLWADAHLLAQIEYRWVVSLGRYDLSRELLFELDQLGTPRQARLNTGPAVWRWESDGYGTSPANEDPDGNGQPTTVNLRFPGQYYDEESGLHYNWHRYYVPRLGRYLSSDPIGVTGGHNLFLYADGRPTRYIDRTGLCPWCIGASIGAIAGGIQAGNSGGWSWNNAENIATGALVGAVSGAVPGLLSTRWGLAAATAVGAAAGASGNLAGQVASGSSLDCLNYDAALAQGVIGAGSGWIGWRSGFSGAVSAVRSGQSAADSLRAGAIQGAFTGAVPQIWGNIYVPVDLGGFGADF
jgi:RHS repeat-associated protein